MQSVFNKYEAIQSVKDEAVNRPVFPWQEAKATSANITLKLLRVWW
jgi:hypothetical protein